VSTLFLIRHGQASFGAERYDVLSEIGARQGRRLGEHLAAAGVALDGLYAGPRERHKDTARALSEAALSGGLRLPEVELLEEFDEYPFDELLTKLPGEVLASIDEAIRARLGDGRRRFQALFEDVMERWRRGEIPASEGFSAFVARVSRGLDRVREAQGRGKRVAVVTSAGPISIAMKLALALDDAVALRLGFVLANASVTELRYREGELALVAFNATGHLLPRDLLTYR
jgi:broad specificity phosphatase PhoE